MKASLVLDPGHHVRWYAWIWPNTSVVNFDSLNGTLSGHLTSAPQNRAHMSELSQGHDHFDLLITTLWEMGRQCLPNDHVVFAGQSILGSDPKMGEPT